MDFLLKKIGDTPLKFNIFNMDPENQHLEKEIPDLENHHFQVPFVKLWGMYSIAKTLDFLEVILMF